MLNDRDSEFTAAGQMSQVLRILLDPEGIGVGVFCIAEFSYPLS
jgi:hypothetical protein